MADEKEVVIKITLEENIQKLESYKDSLSKLQKQQAELRKDKLKDSEMYLKNQKEIEETKVAIGQLTNEVKNQIKYNKSAKGSMDELTHSLTLNKRAYKEMSDEQRKSKAGMDLKTTIDGQDKAIKGMSANIGEHQRNVGNYKKVWEGFTKAFGIVTGAVAAMGIAVKFVKGVIEASDTLMDKWTETITGLKGAWNALNLTVANGGWKNLIRDIRIANEAGQEYAQGMDEIEEAEAGLLVTEAKLNLEISKLSTTAKDATLSNDVRIKAAEEALKKEEQILEARMNLAKKGYDVQAKSMAKLGAYGVGRYEVIGLLTGDVQDPAKLKTIMDRTSEAERTALLNSFAKIYNTQKEYYDGTRRLRATHNSLVEAIRKGEQIQDDKQAKDEEQNYQDRLEAQKDYYNSFMESAELFRQTKFKNEIDSLKLEEEAQIIYAERSIKNKKELELEILRIRLNSLVDQMELTRKMFENDGILTTEEINSLKILSNAIGSIQNQINSTDQDQKTIWDMLGLNQEEFDRAMKIAEMAQNTISQLATISNNAIQNEIKQEDYKYEREKERIAKSLMSNEQKIKATERLDKAHKQKQYELDLKQWKTQQNWAYTQAVIYTALAGIKGFIEGGWVELAAALVAGGLQILTISQQKAPEPPGYTLGGDPPLSDHKGTLIRVNEGMKQEKVMNAGAYSLFGSTLDKMNQIGNSSIANSSGMGLGDQILSGSVQSQRLESAISRMNIFLGYKEFNEYQSNMIKFAERGRA